ncbi:hypothetical protein C1646_819422 [Rhizophagus diaphanus]|nr:hypothetical protein C1646_819422 [Rhizophagus diaphanus] [Rhizophagus sp. MUCL 43196]
MEIDYGKQVFDNYFVQAVTILTIFLVSGKVEVHDDPSKKIVSPFESPEYINSFCLTKSNVIGCKVSYYIRLYIVWFSILICLIDFGLVYAFLNKNFYFPLKFLSPLRFIWFVILSLTPGVVFGILLSDENYYLYKISTGLPISACVSIVRHYVGKDVHTFFSHYINHHRMFKISIDNLANAEKIKDRLETGSNEMTENKNKFIKIKNDCEVHKLGTRAWVRKNIDNTSTCILEITEKLKEMIISDHKIDDELKNIEQNLNLARKEVLCDYSDVSLRFKKAITKRLEKNIGSNLKDEINSNLTQIIYSKYGKFNSNNNNSNPEKKSVPEEDDGSIKMEISSKLTNIKKTVTKLFQKFEDDMEGCGLYQILTEEDKGDIGRNSSNISNINAYLKNHNVSLKDNKGSSREELKEVKCDC